MKIKLFYVENCVFMKSNGKQLHSFRLKFFSVYSKKKTPCCFPHVFYSFFAFSSLEIVLWIKLIHTRVINNLNGKMGNRPKVECSVTSLRRLPTVRKLASGPAREAPPSATDPHMVTHEDNDGHTREQPARAPQSSWFCPFDHRRFTVSFPH